jgi:hypothetical protein
LITDEEAEIFYDAADTASDIILIYKSATSFASSADKVSNLKKYANQDPDFLLSPKLRIMAENKARINSLLAVKGGATLLWKTLNFFKVGK